MTNRQNGVVAINVVLNLPLLYEYGSMTVIEIAVHCIDCSSRNMLSYNSIVIDLMYFM
jgi:hypothetical protein